MQLRVNDQSKAVPDEWHEESLLQVLREALGLVGAKYGCGAGVCGACTVLIDGQPIRSCVTPVSLAVGKTIQTIEGISSAETLHSVQQKWLSASIPQCGYCQSGQILATVALLKRNPQPTDEQIDNALAGHLCRCGTQARVRSAIQQMTRG